MLAGLEKRYVAWPSWVSPRLPFSRGQRCIRTERDRDKGTSRELLVEEGVVVGLPSDQSNVEIARHAQTRAKLLEFTPLDRHRFQARSNLIEGLDKLAEPMMGCSGFGDLFGDV